MDKWCRRLHEEGIVERVKGVYHTYYVLPEGAHATGGASATATDPTAVRAS